MQYAVKSRKSLDVLKSRALTISTHSAVIKATRLFSTLLFFTFLALLLFIITAPHLWGFSFLMVMGGSMSPALPSGSVAIVQPVDVSEIEVGDIIAYQPRHVGSTLTTHRVVNVIRQEGDISFQTAGDNNEFTDKNPVPSDCVMGKMQFHVPFLGYLIYFLKQPLGYVFLVGLPAIIIVILEIRGVTARSKPCGKANYTHTRRKGTVRWWSRGFLTLPGRLGNHEIDELSRWGLVKDIECLPDKVWLICLKFLLVSSLIAITGFVSWNLLSLSMPEAIVGGIGMAVASILLIWLLDMLRGSWVLYSIRKFGGMD